MTTAHRRLLDATVTEKHFQQDVVNLARMRGWLVFHPWNSRHSAAGFPDLCMVRAGRIVFAELKTEKGKASPAQREWLGELGRVAQIAGPDVQVFLWRPSQFDEIVEVLR